MPSTTNPGEVSYVLIVEQSGDTDKDDTVYDFNEADEGLSYVSVRMDGNCVSLCGQDHVRMDGHCVLAIMGQDQR